MSKEIFSQIQLGKAAAYAGTSTEELNNLLGITQEMFSQSVQKYSAGYNNPGHWFVKGNEQNTRGDQVMPMDAALQELAVEMYGKKYFLASEEHEGLLMPKGFGGVDAVQDGEIVVAVDPLDGSANAYNATKKERAGHTGQMVSAYVSNRGALMPLLAAILQFPEHQPKDNADHGHGRRIFALPPIVGGGLYTDGDFRPQPHREIKLRLGGLEAGVLSSIADAFRARLNASNTGLDIESADHCRGCFAHDAPSTMMNSGVYGYLNSKLLHYEEIVNSMIIAAHYGKTAMAIAFDESNGKMKRALSLQDLLASNSIDTITKNTYAKYGFIVGDLLFVKMLLDSLPDSMVEEDFRTWIDANGCGQDAWVQRSRGLQGLGTEIHDRIAAATLDS